MLLYFTCIVNLEDFVIRQNKFYAKFSFYMVHAKIKVSNRTYVQRSNTLIEHTYNDQTLQWNLNNTVTLIHEKKT